MERRLVFFLACVFFLGVHGCRAPERSRHDRLIRLVSHHFKWAGEPLECRNIGYEREEAFELLCEELVIGKSTYDDIVEALGVPYSDYRGVDGHRELTYGLTAVSAGVVVLSPEGRYAEHFVGKDDH